MPAVLSELAQHVEVHPAQRERATPVAVDHVVQLPEIDNQRSTGTMPRLVVLPVILLYLVVRVGFD